METMLMLVTAVALALAIGLSALAWRLLRDNRQRSAARVEALEAMATGAAPEEITPPARFTTIELDETPREPQPQVLSWDARLGERHREREPRRERFMQEPMAPQTPEVMFAAARVERGAPRGRWLALAMVALVMAATVASVYALYRPDFGAVSAAAPVDTAAPRAAGPRPLELLSLRHATDPDGTFTVTGLVQNPFDGPMVRKVVAVIYLFDKDGNYFAGGKASLDLPALQPGEESPFVVHVANVGRISRYRVGFRSEEGGVVAHVDRRGQVPGGTTGNAIDAPGAPHSASSRSEGQ